MFRLLFSLVYLSSFFTHSKNTLKRVGDSRHPCLTHTVTSNQSVNRPFTNTAHWVFLYNVLIRFTSLSLTPIVLINFQRAVRQIMSNVTLQSMMENNVIFFSLFVYFARYKNGVHSIFISPEVELEF